MVFDLAEEREAWSLDPTVHHCNHGSYGAVPSVVREIQRAVQDEVQQNPVRFFAREAQDRVAAARAKIAAFLGQQPDQIALVRNATEAASTTLRGFPFQRGDEAIVLDQEYGAVVYAVQRALAIAGAVLREVAIPMDDDAAHIVARVEAAINSRTRLLVVDHITSATARILPVQQLADLCRSKGIAIAVDASHAPGQIDLDLDRLDADFWFGNLHKWVCAPLGSAVYRIAPRWQARMRPLIVSWRDAEHYPAPWDMLGTVDISAWLAAPAAIDFFTRIGWERVRAANQARMRYGRDMVLSALGLSKNTLPPDAIAMGLVPLPRMEGGREACAALQKRLGEVYRVETAITTCAGAYYLRICGQLYNSAADYEALASAIRTELRG